MRSGDGLLDISSGQFGDVTVNIQPSRARDRSSAEARARRRLSGCIFGEAEGWAGESHMLPL